MNICPISDDFYYSANSVSERNLRPELSGAHFAERSGAK